MRYQVRLATRREYDAAEAMLRRAGDATVVLELPRQNTLAVEPLGDEARARLEALGARIVPDRQLAPDPAG